MAAEMQPSPWQVRRERQPERSAKTEAVLLAAARLFTQHGFQGTSLDDIARTLGVSKPTLYYYIENKEQILFACVERCLAALRAGVADLAARGLSGREALHATMGLYADIVTGEFGQCVIRVGEDPLPEPRRRDLRALNSQVDAEFHALIAQGMQQGWIVPGDAAVAAFTVTSALAGIGRWYRPDQHAADSLQDAIRHCITVLMRGVLSAPAALPPALPSVAAATGASAAPLLRREQHFQAHGEPRLLRCFAERPRHLAQMLAAALQQRPDAEALVCGTLRLSWRGLHHAVSKCAGGLAQRGVQPGDRVALQLGNVPEFVITALACAWLGAVLVPVSLRAPASALATLLTDSAAMVLVAADAQAGLLADALRDPAALPQLRHRFATGNHVPEGFEPFAALMSAPALATPHDADGDALAVLLYTSGTTGEPKGAMITQLNIVHSVMHFVQATGMTAADRSVLAVPMSHVTGLVAQLYSLLHCQGCMVLMPQFKAAEFVRLAVAERMSCVIMVPAMYNLCLLLPELPAAALQHWRVGAYGGAAMPTATIEGLAARLPGLVLMNAYGATETCSPATVMPAGLTPGHSDSVGLALLCAELCIVDAQGSEVPAGGVGEIWIAGPMVVPGYWRNPVATASEFCGGWWRSGDIGSIDAEGFVRILDRKKDVIVRGGYKVFCITVENTLAEHPQVVEAALVGVPCAVLGERVHAHVCVRQLDQRTLAAALQAFCAERLADYAVPETWTIGTAPLPRNANGKIMKRALRQVPAAARV